MPVKVSFMKFLCGINWLLYFYRYSSFLFLVQAQACKAKGAGGASSHECGADACEKGSHLST